MKVYAILLLFIHNIFANEAEVFNVGTVLFSPDELKKDDWSITDTGLLRARRYFQYVLPHPFLVDPSIDHFADLLLDYFTNAANIVKREETDSISTDVLSTALFDAIGGYMKSYILPVTKYGYYGGTVSKDDAQKLYQFYDDIKAYLKTDGSGWRSFDGKFQKPLKIIGNPRDYTRTTRSSCDLLAFYEETPSGFMIPLPSINFDSQSPVMFVPIKVHPLICLNSPESTNTLLNYYNAAKNCLKTRSPNDADEFDNRFRAWLTDDVIAHLDDNDQLYYALGGILTLATDNNCTDCTKMCSFSPPVSPRKPYLHINFGSKKVMILAAILFLEVVWCIPALLYMLYRRRKKKKQSDMLLFVNPNKDKDDKFLSSGAQTRSSILSSCDENTCESFRRFKKKYLREDQTPKTPKNPKKQKKSQTTNQVAPKKLSLFASKKCSKQCATDSCEGFIVEHPIKRFLRTTFHNASTPVFDVKSSHFAKARLFESHNNVKIDGLPIIQNIRNELPLQYDASCETNNKPVEMILNNNRQSSDEQAVIQIESYNCMERLRHSNKSIKSQQNFNEITELYKSSVDTLTQEKSIILSPTLERQSQNKVNIPHRASEEEIALASEFGNSAIITKNIEDKATRVEFHDNITMRKSEEKSLRLHKSYDNAMRIRQSHEHALLVRKSDNDARTRRKFAHVMLSPEKSKQNVINRNKSNEELCEDGKSDIKMTVQKLKNDVTNLEERNYNEKQLHTYKDNFTVQRNNVATTSGQMVDNERILAGPNNALKIIENLDKEAKTLQKSARELMHLMDDRRDTCANPICDCTNCQKSYTEMQKLKTCATITLIADDDSSEKSEQSMKTICKEYQDTEMNHAGNSSRTLINTHVLSTNQIQTVMNTQSSLNPILRSSKLNTADVRSNAKEETKDCARNREKKNEKWDKREETKSKITKKNLKKTDRKNEKIEKTVQEKDEDISDPQEKVEKSKKNYRLKFTGGNKALFEVKIEKPQTTISVGIARGKGPKTSRIPTRILTDNFVRFDDKVIVWPRRPLEAPMGSKIPLPVKKTMDDIVIRHSRNMATTPDPRLNVTL